MFPTRRNCLVSQACSEPGIADKLWPQRFCQLPDFTPRSSVAPLSPRFRRFWKGWYGGLKRPFRLACEALKQTFARRNGKPRRPTNSTCGFDPDFFWKRRWRRATGLMNPEGRQDDDVRNRRSADTPLRRRLFSAVERHADPGVLWSGVLWDSILCAAVGGASRRRSKPPACAPLQGGALCDDRKRAASILEAAQFPS